MSIVIILLAVISLISIGLLVWLAVWEWNHHTTANYVGAISACIAALCIIALWAVVWWQVV